MKKPIPERLSAILIACLFLNPLLLSGGETNSRDEVLSARRDSMRKTGADLQALLERYGGLDEIRRRLAPFRKEVLDLFELHKDNGKRTVKVGDHHFNRNVSPSAIKDSWETSYGEGDPVGVIIDFDRKLRPLGIDLIVVPVPSKIEAYFGEYSTALPDGFRVSPGRVLAMQKLLEAGVEVVDVLPAVLTAMKSAEVPLYETSGHHLSGLGAKLAGELVAERLERYDLEKRDKSSLSERERTGTERIDRSVPMQVWQVLKAGEPYQHVPDSEVAIIGDSNAFAFRTASWASHIARGAGLPVTDLSTSSGAATAHNKLANMGMESLKKRKAVVWIITSSQLERFAWRKGGLRDEPTFMGLVDAAKGQDAIRTYRERKGAGTLSSRITEREVNQVGYALLGRGELSEAIAFFEINCEEFPYSANAFDSLGEAHVKAGHEDDAILAFKKSLSLNPAPNVKESSIKLLRELGVEYEGPPPLKLSAQYMESLAGEYRFGRNGSGVLKVESGGLVYHHSGQRPTKLHPITKNIFTTHAGFVARLQRKDGVLKMSVRGRGLRFTGERVEK